MSHHAPIFKETASDQPIHQIASPLIAVRNGQEEFVSGTAFLIGRGYAITAYHVLADFVERYEGIRDVDSHLNISFEVLLFFSLNRGKDIFPMKVQRVWRTSPLDIAIIALGIPEEWPDDHRWAVPTISLLPPKAGERIAAFGFAESAVHRLDGEAHPSVELHPRTATGLVEEVHHETRDSSRMPFPCFRTNARFDGGMSGGPVFNESGSVCGLICSNMPPLAVGDAHVSYACSLWPMIATLIDVGPNSVATGNYYPLMVLFQSGVLAAQDLAHVSLSRGENDAWVPSGQI